MKGGGMTKAKMEDWDCFSRTCCDSFDCHRREEFWKYQQNYIPDGTYQMVKYEG